MDSSGDEKAKVFPETGWQIQTVHLEVPRQGEWLEVHIFYMFYISLWYLRFSHLTLQLQPPYVNNLFRKSQMCFFCFSLGRFYELKKARSPLQLYDRFDYTDPETNICIERVSHLFKSITVDISLYSELHHCVHLIGFYLERCKTFTFCVPGQ